MGDDRTSRAPGYRWYVLGILILVNIFNTLDRNLISVLGPYIKKDLQIGDAELGMLYGTTFALFYGIFGIPIARLADGWNRVRTLALGLSVWSAMTAASGLANGLSTLGLARIGVGIGEASAGPGAVALLGDYFPPSRRSMSLSLFTAGAFVGGGLAYAAGGTIVTAWTAAGSPLGIAPWQAAFLGLGIPGILLALLVIITVREPPRGISEGKVYADHPRPFASVMGEAAAMFPPWNLVGLWRRGARRQFWRLLLLLAAISAGVAGITEFTDTVLRKGRVVTIILGDWSLSTTLLQWSAIGLSAYAIVAWLWAMRDRDAQAHEMIAGSRTFLTLTVGFGLLTTVTHSVVGFAFVYGVRYFHLAPTDGVTFGVIASGMGAVGLLIGGPLGDLAHRGSAAGRLQFIIAAFVVFVAAIWVQFTTEDLTVFYLAYTVVAMFMTGWMGTLFATGQDLVAPRIRGAAHAVLVAGSSVIGLGLGPYLVGLVSDLTGDLRTGILAVLVVVPPALICLWAVARDVSASASRPQATPAIS